MLQNVLEMFINFLCFGSAICLVFVLGRIGDWTRFRAVLLLMVGVLGVNIGLAVRFLGLEGID